MGSKCPSLFFTVFFLGGSLRTGVLRKGFTVRTPKVTVEIPPGVKVRFYARSIEFEGYPDIRLYENNGKWYAFLFGQKAILLFDYNNPPYPISYYMPRSQRT
jgi:hypothetical protein